MADVFGMFSGKVARKAHECRTSGHDGSTQQCNQIPPCQHSNALHSIPSSAHDPHRVGVGLRPNEKRPRPEPEARAAGLVSIFL